MAGEGPREWSPRGTVWTVFIDSQDGFTIEVFRKEKNAYLFAVKEILTDDKDKMEKADLNEFEKLVRTEKYEEAMELYNVVMGDYGSERRMSFYTINKKIIQ